MGNRPPDQDGQAANPNEKSFEHPFVETRWSQVLLAGGEPGSASEEAIESLCATYWHPIYSFLRHQGRPPADAEDLTQQFFLHILRRNTMARADPSKGRFRSYLLGALRFFLTDQYRRASAQKRGGGLANLPFNLSDAEQRYLEEPDSELTPEEVYDRRWAAALLDRAFKRLRTEFVAAGHTARFECLKGFLTGQAGPGDYETAGGNLGMSAKTAKMAVYRLRQRYRQLVRSEACETLEGEELVEDELMALFG